MYRYEATVNYKNKSGATETVTCVVLAKDGGEALKKMQEIYPTYTYIGTVKFLGKA